MLGLTGELVTGSTGAAVLGALGMVLASATAVPSGRAHAAEQAKPYKVENGRVDANTVHGYLLYGENCQRCHMPDAVGRDYPYTPALKESVKTISESQFKSIVINGKQCGEPLVMPSFGGTADVALHLDDLYAYLMARSDGVLGPGRPKRIGESGE